jgi:hypothetical protein
MAFREITSSGPRVWIWAWLFVAVLGGIRLGAAEVVDPRREILGPWRLVLSLDVFGNAYPGSDGAAEPTYWVYSSGGLLERLYFTRGGTELGKLRTVTRSYELKEDGQMRDWGDSGTAEPRGIELKEDVLVSRHVTGGVMFFRRVDKVPKSLADRAVLDGQRDLVERFRYQDYFSPERFAKLTLSEKDGAGTAVDAAPEWREMPPKGERMHAHEAGAEAVLPAWVETDGRRMREWTMPAKTGDVAQVSVNVSAITLLDAHRIAIGDGYRLLSCLETPNPELKARRYSAVWVKAASADHYDAGLNRLGLKRAMIEVPAELRW